jgi:ABC-type polysaccharide/polyol phosphate transport system ATPase subunit
VSVPVIEVDAVDKSFRIPTHRVETLKERVVRPFARPSFRELHALRSVSFEVGRGEFFGIVGRNGSGKSTLLKILAGIYSADGGEVRVSGQIAPFIELGVGFDQDLSARENVLLNGVMIGLSKRESLRRLDSVVEFAGLEDFVDLKLKNYSSGMLVRLAFSVMLESDAEILLIDEVLAVGDAAFQGKCKDTFREMHDAGRTIVFVTHDMTQVEHFCNRALLLRGGAAELLGGPEEVARRYFELNFDTGAEDVDPVPAEDSGPASEPPVELRLVDAWLERDGQRCEDAERGVSLELHALFEGIAEVRSPSFALVTSTADGVDVFGFGAALDPTHGDVLEPGGQAHVKARFANALMPGRYSVKCWVMRDGGAEMAFHAPRMLDFVVTGEQHVSGLVDLAAEPVAQIVEREPQAL